MSKCRLVQRYKIKIDYSLWTQSRYKTWHKEEKKSQYLKNYL